MKRTRLLTLVLMGALAQGCSATTRSSTTWTGPPSTAQAAWVRHGRVEWIREDVQHRDGNPAAGAATGAIIGALIGGRGPGALFGAMGGAAIGASASQGHTEARQSQVMVRFDDGYSQTFIYGGYSPFHPGEAVVQTPQGLYHG